MTTTVLPTRFENFIAQLKGAASTGDLDKVLAITGDYLIAQEARIIDLLKDAEPVAVVNAAFTDGEFDKQKLVAVLVNTVKLGDLLYTHPPAPDHTDLLKMIAHRARSFPNFPLGHHITEVFAAIGEEPPEPAPKVITASDVDADIEYWRQKYLKLDAMYDELEKEKIAIEQNLMDRT